jgi:hypothetical protein
MRSIKPESLRGAGRSWSEHFLAHDMWCDCRVDEANQPFWVSQATQSPLTIPKHLHPLMAVGLTLERRHQGLLDDVQGVSGATQAW